MKDKSLLPNFLLVGAAKSGTTSLYHYLKQHPEIFMSPVKEPFFFSFINKKPYFKGPFDQKTNEEIITSLDEYKNLFQGVNDEKAIGECSNSYLYFQDSAAHIKKFIPECKIIIILRNPLERAFSHYMQAVMIGHENLIFEEALKKEKERLKVNWRWHYQYVGQGMYYHQVKKYLEIFEMQMVKICFFEDLIHNPKDFMKKIYQFLGVQSEFVPELDKIYNRSGLPKNRFVHKFLRDSNLIKEITRPFTSTTMRGKLYNILSVINYDFKNKPIINKETRKYLADAFKNDSLKLQNIINRDLSAWFD